jgi:hypothetical protein
MNCQRRRASVRVWQTPPAGLCVYGHGIAEVIVALGNPSAIKADEARRAGHVLDLLELAAACEDTQMSLVLSFA